MKNRLFALLLALVLVITCIPMPTDAEEISVSAVQQQIKDIYKNALRRTGRSSFHGYCGTWVGWELYLLGIDASLQIVDGNRHYDVHSKNSASTGGFRAKKYPASKYTMLSALNAISQNGTEDVYNILIGFQSTNTPDGRLYGHAVVINAIIDGRVYFTECYNISIAGKRWKEGTPVNCTIQEFCKYYGRWATFEGAIYFGLKNYAGACLGYPCDMEAVASEEAALYLEPCDPGVYDADPTEIILAAGDVVKAVALLQTPQGAFWYEIERNGKTYYIQAEKLSKWNLTYDDVGIANLKVPTTIRKGRGYVVKGELSSQYCTIRQVAMTVCSAETGQVMFTSTMDVDETIVSLGTKKLDKNMLFTKLAVGEYTLSIRASVSSYHVVDGKPEEIVTVLDLKKVQFQVAPGSGKNYVVNFDPNGGTTEIDQVAIYANETIDVLPEATREGYVFAGWSLDPEGKKPVTEQTTFNANATLYAQWEVDYENVHGSLQEVEQPGWHMVNGSWHYHPKNGWFVSNGYRFYQLKSGELLTGWQTIAGAVYYFNGAGVQLSGWQTIYGERYYLYLAGGMAVGEVEIDGTVYRFSDQGVLLETA